MVIKPGLLLLLCFAFGLGYYHAAAQIPGMRKYTLLDGYTATCGYFMEQDQKGYLWIGTDNGGIRFDGKRFVELQQGQQGRKVEIMRCAPLDKGLTVLAPFTGPPLGLYRNTMVTLGMPLHYGPSRDINRLVHDMATDTWWFYDGVPFRYIYRIEGRKVTAYRSDDSFGVTTLIGNYLIGRTEQSPDLKAFHILTGVTQTLYKEDKTIINTNEDGLITQEASGFIFTLNKVSNLVNIYQYNPGDSILHLYRSISIPSPATPVAYCFLDRYRHLWLKLAGKGAMAYYGDISRIRDRQEALYTIAPGILNNIFVDHHQNIWLSCPGNALYFLSRNHFRNALAADRFPLKTETPQSITGDGKDMLCISYAKSNALAFTGDKGPRVHRLNDKFFNYGINGILNLDTGKYVAWGRGLALVDGNKPATRYIKMPCDNCKDVCRYGANGLLVATSCGLLYMKDVIHEQPGYESIFNNRTLAVAVGEDQRILIGTPVGLYQKRQLKEAAQKVHHPLLGDGNITCIQMLPQNNALIGTNGDGLYLYRADGSASRIAGTTVNPLSHIKKLYRQAPGMYWVATNKGASCLVLDDRGQVKRIKDYTFYDGLPSNNVTDVYVSRDTAYMATAEGLGIIPLTDSMHSKMPSPAVYINTVQTGKTIFSNMDASLLLARDQNDLKISLSAISYESLGNIDYYYRLYPFQDRWAKTGDPDILFTQVPPGTYTFQAYARNANGIKSDRLATLQIVIRPAFWQTLAFKAGLLLVGISLLYFVMRWRIQGLERKRYASVQQKRRLAELELEAIKAQINPHFIYNCLNSIQYLNYKAEYRHAQEYLDIFGRLIRMTMEYARRPFITLEEETAYLSSYLQLEKLRFKEDLQYEIRIDDKIDKTTLLPAMLLQPYVENALKHGIAGNESGGKISIQLQQEATGIRITIKDNGPGFPDLRTSDRLGLRLAGSRAFSYNELFNLNIQVHYSNEQDRHPGSTGAIVTLEISTIGYGKNIS